MMWSDHRSVKSGHVPIRPARTRLFTGHFEFKRDARQTPRKPKSACRHLLPLSRMRFSGLLLAFAAVLTLSGCRSAFIDATVSNHTAEPLALIEVDYPSASFGTQTLAPGQDFHYRFKVLGSGPTTVLWTDSVHHDRKNSGPVLREGDEGKLIISFGPDAGPTWSLQLINRSSGS